MLAGNSNLEDGQRVFLIFEATSKQITLAAKTQRFASLNRLDI
jgi:hypothetical protein